jgi:hypothetical protein
MTVVVGVKFNPVTVRVKEADPAAIVLGLSDVICA